MRRCTGSSPGCTSTSTSSWRSATATAAHLRDLGLPASLTATLPNFIPDDGFSSQSRAGAGEFALAAGRLTEEKGFDTAIAAARETRTCRS